MKQNARPSTSFSTNTPTLSTSKHKTFRYTPRSISQAHARKITTESPLKTEEKKKRITQPKQPPPEPPIPSYLSKKSDIHSTPRTTKRSKQKDQLLRDPSCIALREHLFDNCDLENYDDEKLKILLGHLREYSLYSALYREYDDAERANDLQEKIKEELLFRTSNVSREKNLDSSNEGHLSKELRESQEELDDFDFQYKEKLQQLENKIQKDTDSFEEKWRKIMPTKYRKPSTKLITMYDVERKLSLNREFEKAKMVKAEAEQLELIEMENAQKQLISDYTTARQKLDAKHEEERQHFFDTMKNRRDLLVARLASIKNKLANRDNVVANKQSELLKTKESTFDPNERSPVSGSGAAINRRDYHYKSFNLLPPLLPPNDEKIREKSEKEIKQQKRKNKQFMMKIKEKEKEADDSDMNFSSKDDWNRDFTIYNTNTNFISKRYQQKSSLGSRSKKRSETTEKVDSDFVSFQTSEKFSTKTSTTTIERVSKTNQSNNISSSMSDTNESRFDYQKSDENASKSSKSSRSSKSNQFSSSISSQQKQRQNNNVNNLSNILTSTTNQILNSSISSKTNNQISSSVSKDLLSDSTSQSKYSTTERESNHETFDSFSESNRTESESKSKSLHERDSDLRSLSEQSETELKEKSESERSETQMKGKSESERSETKMKEKSESERSETELKEKSESERSETKMKGKSESERSETELKEKSESERSETQMKGKSESERSETELKEKSESERSDRKYSQSEQSETELKNKSLSEQSEDELKDKSQSEKSEAELKEKSLSEKSDFKDKSQSEQSETELKDKSQSEKSQDELKDKSETDMNDKSQPKKGKGELESILNELSDLSSLADVLSFQSSASNRNLDTDSKVSKDQLDIEDQNKSGTFDLTQTRSYKAEKSKIDGK